MTEACPTLRELLAAGVAAERGGLLEDHVRNCPRCRSLLAEYDLFLNPPEPPGESEAAERLGAALRQRVLGRGLDPAPSPSSQWVSTPVTEPPAPRRSQPRPMRWLPFLVPACGAGAILIGVALLARDAWRPQAPALRGESGMASSLSIAAYPPRTIDGNRIELRWNRVPSADHYRIRLLSADVKEIHALAAGPDTSWALDPSFLAGPEPPVLFEIQALSDGDVVALSTPRRLIPAR